MEVQYSFCRWWWRWINVMEIQVEQVEEQVEVDRWWKGGDAWTTAGANGTDNTGGGGGGGGADLVVVQMVHLE